MFQFGLVPTINKATRMTNKTIAAIDYIITNSNYNKNGYFWLLSNYMQFQSSLSSKNNKKNRYLYKRVINESSKVAFKRLLSETSWGSVTDWAYIKFTETITQIYYECFQKTKFKKTSNKKDIAWITKSLLNANKNSMKNSEKIASFKMKKYKDYRKIFQTIMKSKRKYYSAKLLQFQGYLENSPAENPPLSNFPEEDSPVKNSPVSFFQIIFDEKIFLFLKIRLFFHQGD